MVSSPIVWRDDFFNETTTYYDSKPERVVVNQDIVLTGDNVGTVTPAFRAAGDEDGAVSRASVGSSARSGGLTVDLAGMLFNDIMTGLMEVSNFGSIPFCARGGPYP